MSGSLTDRFTETFNGQNPTSTTVASPRAILGSTLVCQNLAGWPTSTNTAVHFATYQKDSTGAKIAGTQVDWKGIVSGSSINSLTRQGGAADGGNGVGDIVEMMPTYAWANDLAKGLEVLHNNDGSWRSGAALTLPTIADFTNATHTHTNTAGGGILTPSALGTDSAWAWPSWTPTWANITIGNGTVTTKYKQTGKQVICRLRLDWGSTTSITGLDPSFTLPVTAVSGFYIPFHAIGSGGASVDTAGGSSAALVANIRTTTTASVHALLVNATYATLASLSNTVPVSFTTGSVITAEFFYEAA